MYSIKATLLEPSSTELSYSQIAQLHDTTRQLVSDKYHKLLKLGVIPIDCVRQQQPHLRGNKNAANSRFIKVA